MKQLGFMRHLEVMRHFGFMKHPGLTKHLGFMKRLGFKKQLWSNIRSATYPQPLKTFFLAGCLSLSLLSPGLMAESAATENAWRFQVTPYLWLIKTNAKLHHGIKGVPALSISRSRGDILNDLKAAAFLSATARNKQWVIMGDYSYASLSERDRLPLGFRAKTRLKQHMATLMGGIHVPTGQNHGLELLAGARYWNVSTQLQLSPLRIERRFKKEFLEPVIGLRWRASFGQDKRWSILGYGDVGGMGNSSRHSWQALASLNYALTPAHYLSVGYRYLKLNYKSGGHRLNADYSGPLLGFSYQF